MDKLLLCFCFLPTLLFAQSREILEAPQVDERIELLSIVFRLAGAQEYSANRFPGYVEQIEKHFTPYKEHDLVRYIKKKVRKRGVGYDAVMSMAISITPPPNMQAIRPFSKTFPDPRWGEKRATKFLRLLNEFYQDAQVASFFTKNKDLYQLAAERFNENYLELDLDWYQDFYGAPPKGSFKIVNGLGNGGGNYGPKVLLADGTEVVYAIMGTWSIDSLGQPQYPLSSYFPTLLHEFNHSFVNHIMEQYQEQLSPSGKAIYQPLSKKMQQQAYGNWQTMLSEAVVRASVIKYLQDHDYDPDYISGEMNQQINRGFIWTPELVMELERYDQQRDQFPDLESFMPKLVQFFERTAVRIGEIEQDIEAQRPQVVGVHPFNNGDQNVDPKLKQITIEFDQPMLGKGYSINLSKKGQEVMPKLGEISYSEDQKSVIIELTLEPDHNYEFILVGKSFRSKKGLGINDYEVHFKTGKE